LDARRDLHGYVAGALVMDLELTASRALADSAFEPIEMHLGEAVQSSLHWRGNRVE
jgi:hypothetical protein